MDEKDARLEAPDSLKELPWLVYTHGNSKHKQIQSFYSPINSKACIKSIPQLRHKKLLLSKHGWLLLQDRSQVTNLSLFNPVTSQAIVLPPLLQVWLHVDGDESCFRICVLTLPPDRDDCMLLLCFDRPGLLAFCRPAQPDCTWVTQPLELQGEAVVVAHLVPLNGVLYGLTLTDVLFCAEDKNDLKPLALKPLQTVMDPDIDFYPDGELILMLESCGHLYTVNLYFIDRRRIVMVKVFELNLQQKQNSYNWVEVKSLNGRAFFISNHDASWCWGDSVQGIAGNCIYFCVPELLETLYLYNLQDQTCITLSPCPSMVSPCDDDPLWVIPQHQHQQQQSRLSASEERQESIQKTTFVNRKVSPIERHELLQTHDEEDILSKLPFHLIELVANRMHLFEYWSFRVSCKILISRLPKPHQKSINTPPLLMLFNQNDRLYTLIDPCRHGSRSNNSVLPPHLDSPTLEFCKSGWVFYLVGKKLLEYANVLTRLSGRFPPLPTVNFDIHYAYYKSIAFSTYPTSSECIIVAIYANEAEVAFSYIRPGDGTWNTSYFRHDEYHPFRPTHSTPVFMNGAFYYLDVSGYLGEFRSMDEPTWEVYYDKPQTQGGTLKLTSLVECNGQQLYSIFVGSMGNWIQVFWFDYSNKYWVEIHHLENVSFFISRKSSLSIVTNDDQMRNKIFLPYKNVVYYSLSTKKYHIWGLDDVRDNLLGFEEELLHWSCWF